MTASDRAEQIHRIDTTDTAIIDLEEALSVAKAREAAGRLRRTPPPTIVVPRGFRVAIVSWWRGE